MSDPTTRAKALAKLIAKVEAGWPPDIDTPYMPPFNAVFGISWISKSALDANNGSLDAAKALHGAVVPGWDVDLELRPLGPTIESGLSDVIVYSPYRDRAGVRGCDAIPARAWLLAILRALAAIEGEN